jgi:two-component system response regulator
MLPSQDRVILLVEDNPDDEMLALRAFRKNEIRNPVVVARDGAEALDFLIGTGISTDRGAIVRPSLVLLDLNLPKISGLDVLRRVRANPATKHLAVVVLTTSNEDRDVIESYDLGANSYVRKPVEFNAFMDAVKQLGAYWLVLNEPPPVIAR